MSKSREELIIKAIKGSQRGLTSIEIAKKTGLSLKAVRICLRVLQQQHEVYWYADWYGKNLGYTRRYTLEKTYTVK